MSEWYPPTGRAEVEFHEVACRQHRLGGAVMRDRRVRAGRDDGLEGDAVGAVVEHQRFEFAAHLLLGAARPQPAALEQLRQRRIGCGACRPQQRDLVLVLDHP